VVNLKEPLWSIETHQRVTYVGRTFSGALVVKVVDDPNDLCVLCREEDLENIPSDRPVLAD
jgi:hypothetical protein